MRERTCCFTGHRNLPTGWGRWKLKTRLEKVIIEQIENGVQFFGVGGALGFDTLAAQTVLKLKKTHPHIKLILVLPCLTQTRGWPSEDVEEYERIKGKADKVTYTAKEYFPGCMHKRNCHLIDNSSVCIAYLIKNEGGTAYTVSYAKDNGVRVINIAD